MKPPPYTRTNSFKATLTLHGFVPLPTDSRNLYHCTLENGRDIIIHLPLPLSRFPAKTIRALILYREEIQALANHKAQSPHDATPPETHPPNPNGRPRDYRRSKRGKLRP